MNKLIYLATPYSHDYPEVRSQRYELACQIAGKLMQQEHLVFSPIAHSHSISLHSELDGSWETWQKFCHEMVQRCDQLWIATISGWETSKGIAEEVSIAKWHQKPVLLLQPDTLETAQYDSWREFQNAEEMVSREN